MGPGLHSGCRRAAFPPTLPPTLPGWARNASALLLAAALSGACARNGSPPPQPAAPQPDIYVHARAAMVAEQIEARGVRDTRVLAALRKVPRERFVPANLRHSAHDDRPLPIGLGQTISQPYIVAFMSAAIGLAGHEKVLEIGTGSGYQAAILSELAREVYTIEIVPELAERSRDLLRELGCANVQVRTGDGYRGWPAQAPFDAIVVTAAPDHIPEPLLAQLADGGRMIIPVGDAYQELLLLTRRGERIERKSLLPVRFVPMTGEAR